LVAAMKRASIARGVRAPILSTARSSSTLKNLVCVANGSSPTSSRKIVPPDAASNRPALACCAPVEGKTLVTEQLPFQQQLAERCAIQRHEGTVGACRTRVKGARQHLLAHSGLSEEEYVDLRRSGSLSLRVQRSHILVLDDCTARHRIAAMTHRHAHRTEKRTLPHRELRRFTLQSAKPLRFINAIGVGLVADERAVSAAQIFDQDRRTDAQRRVTARNRRVIQTHLIGLVPSATCTRSDKSKARSSSPTRTTSSRSAAAEVIRL
jgi:hypothetical protein